MLSRPASSWSVAPGSPLPAATSGTHAAALSDRPEATAGFEGTASRAKETIGGPTPGPSHPFTHGVVYVGSARGGVYGGVPGSSVGAGAAWLIMRRKSGTDGSDVGMSASAFISIAIEARRVGSAIGGADATSPRCTSLGAGDSESLGAPSDLQEEPPSDPSM
eukprot:CAMPEP_0119086780 /NCGR_PEP_ID=MMETSP1178-20130426/139318_1 /TAXON_ID=33656 /ORGANISM="unid sp, Strain CCMP2000" /LENGTH=162 /DNA_ID=CAMNT_0007069935 /DNA_START=264 /DNA_END=752 /DNA_ORIENTATION=+